MTRRVRESELDAMRKRAERAEAQVVRLRGAGERLMDTSPDSRAVAYWVEVAEETKDQSLAEIRAEAVESVVNKGCPLWYDREWLRVDEVNQYAQQIREGKE